MRVNDADPKRAPSHRVLTRAEFGANSGANSGPSTSIP